MKSQSTSTSTHTKMILVARMLTGAVLMTAILGGILFTAAGRMDWIEAWWLIGIYGFFLLSFMLLGLSRAPDLMQERSRVAANVKGWDKLLNLVFTLSIIGLLVLAGFDARYGWSAVQVEIKGTGGLSIVLACLIILWTIRSNAYLSRWARIQGDRGHQVVSGGPYRFVRHPMYAAIIVFVLAMPLQLGSWPALLPAILASSIYVARTTREDQMLHEELAGYREYAGQVHYRLIPGIW